eukprot:CAMPEP_0197035914 /NCGR_PEP_ID=MMETSP1384-20130603/13570_1 /TAXON_ID=29189 /ORGANISM="Ammonia sp." /LENGTH=359 /DNA_ID=CAMNT_0042466023 /DNA_START=31 /DNA_END=1110 /DNA_ORIENTATION=+
MAPHQLPVLQICALLIGSIVLCTLSDSDFECERTLTGTTSGSEFMGTYDLCDFVVQSDSYDGWYAAYDNRTHANIEYSDVNYTFYFNIASNVAKATPDAECDNYNLTYRQAKGLVLGYCKDIQWPGLHNSSCNSDDMVPINNMVGAYQAKKGSSEADEKCWRLHDGVTEPVWTFLDVSDPALGIQLTYINGDYCQYWGKNREFKMKFICSNDVQITPKYVETVFEPTDEGCSYELHMESIKGCPTECIADNDDLCSGHGVCDYDWQRGEPKCFCYYGWYGEDCHDDVDINEEIIYQDSDNNYVGALVVVILLLLVILFILGYLFMRYTKIQNQPFDFKFLQQTKTKRAKKSGADEYETE